MPQTFFADLNPEQIKAVEHTSGPSIILAGAGSGKTRVLVHKVSYLIQKASVYPKNILMITFTNKAAAEMKNRMGAIKLGYIGTFHSFCARVLRIDGEFIELKKEFAIYDGDDQLTLIKTILKDRGEKKFTPSFFLNRISAAKNELITPQNYLKVFSDYSANAVYEVYEAYQKALKKSNACDFDDLILKVIELFTKNKEVLDKYQDRYKYLLVDEFQDTNLAQYVLTRMLAAKYENITIVGDFSQSIYSWRGADIKNLEKFQKDFPSSQVFYLQRNYRSTAPILNFAFNIISKNKSHPILELYTDNDHGDDVMFLNTENEQEEAIFVVGEIERLKDKHESFAVLYRTNAQSRIIEEAFLHYGIPYLLVGGVRFYERREIKDILSYLRLLVNPVDTVALDRIKKLGKKRFEDFQKLYDKLSENIKNVPTVEAMEEVFENTGYLKLFNKDDEDDFSRLENIKELKSVAINFPNITEFLEQVALVESEYFQNEKKDLDLKNRVKLMTLHQAKGLEFDVVFIVGVEEGILPHARSIDDYFQLEEERRLFYVGITRARKRLYITHATRRFIFGRRTDAIRSRFLLENEA